MPATTETEKLVKKKVDVEECCERLLGLCGAVNDWIDLLGELRSDRHRERPVVPGGPANLITIADEIAKAGKQCLAEIDDTLNFLPSYEGYRHLKYRRPEIYTRLLLLDEMRKAGDRAADLSKEAKKRLVWSVEAFSWEKVYCRKLVKDVQVACRNALQLGFELQGKTAEDAHVAMVVAERTAGQEKSPPASKSSENERPIGDWFVQLDGFKRVRWGSTEFPEFRPGAARAVEAMHNDYSEGGQGLSAEQVRTAAGSSASRTRDIFGIAGNKTHPAYGTMIVCDQTSKRHRLVPPS